MSASVWFTVAVLVVFVAAIAYTAICARVAVARESAAEPTSGAVRQVAPLTDETTVADDVRRAA